MKTMKAMISQPMNGLTDAEITATRNRAIQYLKSEGYEVVDSYFKDEFAEPPANVNKGIYFLAKSLEKMSECTMVYFCRGANAARGCRIEHAVADAYGLTAVHEVDEQVKTGIKRIQVTIPDSTVFFSVEIIEHDGENRVISRNSKTLDRNQLQSGAATMDFISDWSNKPGAR